LTDDFITKTSKQLRPVVRYRGRGASRNF